MMMTTTTTPRSTAAQALADASGLSYEQAALALRYAGVTTKGKPCACGCGGTTKGGTWLPGHDAKHASVMAGGPKKQPRECGCECGQMTRGGTYRPGHDAKHLSRVLTAMRTVVTETTTETSGGTRVDMGTGEVAA